MKKIYFHIGYFKTGTTFLEENLFSKHKDINYLNKSNEKFGLAFIKAFLY